MPDMSAQGPERLPDMVESQRSPAQQRVVKALLDGPRGRLSGPFIALLRSPELCERAQRLGEYLRFAGVLPQRLRELAILTTARHWRQNYEWHTHAAIAEQCGLSRELIAALAADGPWPPLAADEALVLRFCTELHGSHCVDDPLYGQALELLGEQGLVELCAICGYYALLAMVLNVARTALPAGAKAVFEPPAASVT
jgi:4-carboxymuconolactone decarboxylase